MKLNSKKLGQFIEVVDERNSENISENLLGISIDKKFMKSVANTVGTDLTKYKLLKKGFFACNTMHVGRDKRLPVALYDSDQPAIISPAYCTFKVVDNNILDLGYLKLVFSSAAFDHECWFRTDGDIRGGLSWTDLCNISLPVPTVEQQRKIVWMYQTVEKRIKTKKEINIKLEELLHISFKKITNDKQIIFKNQKIKDLTQTIDNRGKTPPNSTVKTSFPLIEIAALRTSGRIATYRNCVKYVSEEAYNSWFRSGHPRPKDILMSTVGSLAELKVFWGNKGSIAQNIVAFRCNDESISMYLYQYLLYKQRELAAYEIGSVQASIKVSQVVNYVVAIPPKEILTKFDKLATSITDEIYKNEIEIDYCYKICNTILQKLAMMS